MTSLSGISDHRQSFLYTLITALIAAAVVRRNTSQATGILYIFIFILLLLFYANAYFRLIYLQMDNGLG